MSDSEKRLLDEELALERLLALATTPPDRPEARRRLILHVEAMRAAARRPVLRWSAALPLAASLLLGIYLGGQSSSDPWLPTSEQAAADDDDGDLSGIGEAEIYAEENLT